MGGIERASSTIANEISEKGHNVIYFAMFRRSRFFDLNPNVIFDEQTDGSNVKSLNFVKTLQRIRKQVKNYQPDVILAYNKFYASLTLLALVGTKNKIFISERSSPFFRWPMKLRLINRLAYFVNPPKGIIAQTNIAAEYQRKEYGQNVAIEVIPNALRTVTLYPETERKKQVLAVGRLGDYLKGFDRLIEAFGAIDAPDWKLVIAGGDKPVDLMLLADKYNLGNRIQFLGKVRDIDQVYAESSIFVIPSRGEGFPNALCEAMAAGLPCIAFDFVAGPRDIITDQVDGIIVPDNDISAMTDAISLLINSPEKRNELGINARKIVERLDKDIVGKKVLDFILE